MLFYVVPTLKSVCGAEVKKPRPFKRLMTGSRLPVRVCPIVMKTCTLYSSGG